MSKSSPNISDLIVSAEAEKAAKQLDYYDGELEKHLIALLNDPNKGRKEWQSRGIIPRTRNILKMIIDKSGLLFNDKAPILNVYDMDNPEVVDEDASTTLQDMLEDLDWVEFFTNFDSVVRMLKTACILVQYDQETDTLFFDILTRKNSAVILNRNNKDINTLVYQTMPQNEDGIQEFRVYTSELIQDIQVNKNGQESIINSEPNVFGFIPLVAFHDTNIPRTDFWNTIPSDLLQINEMYNLHITDSEYAASWSKLKTLFTNAKIATGGEGDWSVTQMYDQALPRLLPSQSSMIGGPSRVVQIDTTGVDSPFVEYKGPEVDLQPIDDMMNKWVADFAADWAVNVKMGGQGTADSGFKLIVEEMPNLELRKKRAKMFEAGFKRLYRVIRDVVNTYVPGTYLENTELFAKFSEPILPVADAKAQEEAWSRRIMEGRATRVDYFMQTQGMTKEDTQAKVNEIDVTPPPTAIPIKFTAKA